MNTITLEDDAEAGGWKVGDTVVIASTDFNFEQVKFKLVRNCGSKKELNHPIEFIQLNRLRDLPSHPLRGIR